MTLYSQQIAAMKLNMLADQENARWPEELTEIPLPPSATVLAPKPPFQAFRSRHFLVQVFSDATDEGRFVRLSVQRVEHAAFRTDAKENPISWDELMACKRQCGYGDTWAVEVFPPDAEIVNRARMRHLFLVSASRIPFRWHRERSGRSGLVAGEMLEPLTEGEA